MAKTFESLTTFESLKTLAGAYIGGKDSTSLIDNYINGDTNSVLAYIFCNNYSLFTSKVSVFKSRLTTEDIDSIILESIDKGIMSYDENTDKRANLVPYITQCVYNNARTAAQSIKKGDMFLIDSKRFEENVESKDNTSEALSADKEIAVACMAEEDGYDRVLDNVAREQEGIGDDLSALIKRLELSESQTKYLTIIINNPDLKDIEIARQLGVGRNSISMMKKRIREKVSKLNLHHVF